MGLYDSGMRSMVVRVSAKFTVLFWNIFQVHLIMSAQSSMMMPATLCVMLKMRVRETKSAKL